MVAQVTPQIPPLREPIAIGQVFLTLPIGVDAKPYIRQILQVELAAIKHPKAKDLLALGLRDAQTDEDFSSLIESFHLCRSDANAEILFASLEQDAPNPTVYHSVEMLRREFNLEEEVS